MFPIHNASGRLVGFGGRTLGDDKAKYVNTNETDRFHKGTLLYGLHHAKREIRESGRAILCEGYFDVIGTVACGLDDAVAGMGTALTPEQAKLLSRYAEEVVVAYDGDNAGENAFRRALPLLLADGLGVRRARFPGSHDPDSLRLEQGEEAVREAVDKAEDAVTAEIDRLVPSGVLRDPQLQAKAATAVAELLRPIPDAILRYGYARGAADRLGIPVEMLARRMGGGDGRPAASPSAPARASAPRRAGSGASLVRSVEEQVLQELFQQEDTARIPPLEYLPPPEVFFDTECRNIYEAFCALYAEAGTPPEAQRVTSRLADGAGIVARFAKIMVEGNFVSGRTGLSRIPRQVGGSLAATTAPGAAEGDRGGRAHRGSRAPRPALAKRRDRLSRSLHRGSRLARVGLGVTLRSARFRWS